MGKSAPKPPNPAKVAAAQTQSNIDTAKATQQLGMTNTVGPTGSVSYVVDPTAPSGYRAVASYTPEMQAVYGQQLADQASSLANVGNTLNTPFSFDAGRAKTITDIQHELMDPGWQNQQDAFENQLVNSGYTRGDERWNNAMRDFGDSKNRAYDQMNLDAYTTANNAALTERNIPLTDYATLAGIGNPQSIQTPNAPQPTVANTDVEGPIMQAYQAQVQQNSADMGGLFGMLGAGLGGWAQGGFQGAGALAGMVGLSDERAKTDVERIGSDPRGWGIYKFRYKGAEKRPDTWRVGFMAQEVEKVRPDAVVVSPSTGIRFVNYERLAA